MKKRDTNSILIFFFSPAGGQSHVPLADEQEDGEETDVSLITGALRSRNLLLSEPTESSCSSSVVLRNQTMTVANTNSAGRSDATFKFKFKARNV